MNEWMNVFFFLIPVGRSGGGGGGGGSKYILKLFKWFYNDK